CLISFLLRSFKCYFAYYFKRSFKEFVIIVYELYGYFLLLLIITRIDYLYSVRTPYFVLRMLIFITLNTLSCSFLNDVILQKARYEKLKKKKRASVNPVPKYEHFVY